VPVSMHTKFCCDALGTEVGLDAIARAGFVDVVVWLGERCQHLDAIEVASHHGLEVRAVAMPKMRLLDTKARALLHARVTEIRARTAVPISVIFGDAAGAGPAAAEWRGLGAWLGEIASAVVVENGGRRAERFSSLDAVAELLHGAPALMMALDLGHLAAVGAPAGLPAALTPERVFQVELHDNDGRQDLHLPLGSGGAEGSAEALLTSLGLDPERVMIETNPACGPDEDAWVHALRREREALEVRLASAGAAGRPA
jgi:sugar phosphate isomerase/epimerase